MNRGAVDSSVVRSILVVLMGSIGDFVRGLAIAPQLKRHFPGVTISWLVEPVCEELARQNPYIDRVVVFRRNRPLSGLFELRRELREHSFDICLDLQRHLKSGFFSWLSRAARRIGFHPENSKEGNWLFQTEYIEFASDEIPKLEHYFLFLKKLGVSVERPLDFGVAAGAEPETVRVLREKARSGYVALILKSSWKSKDWVPEGYERLVESIFAHTPYAVVLCGDKSSIELAKRLGEAGHSERIINIAGRTTLTELGYLLRGAKACVGPDSGPAHIAAAVGTPHITLFGPTSPSRVSPIGSEALSIQSSIGCSPCYRRECPGLNRVCMRLLSPDIVWQRLKPLLVQGQAD